MDLVKIIKSKNILQKVKKARPVKAQIKTSIENDVNKAILSKGRKLWRSGQSCGYPCCKRTIQLFRRIFAACVGVWWGVKCSFSKWMGERWEGKSQANHNKICLSNRRMNAKLVRGSYRVSTKVSTDEEHCVWPKCWLACGLRSRWHHSSKGTGSTNEVL